MLDDKVRLKVVRYETTVSNADIGLSSNIGSWAVAEVWARGRAAVHAGLKGPVGPENPAGQVRTIYGYDSQGRSVTIRPFGPLALTTGLAGVTVWDGRSNGGPQWNGGNEPYAPGTVRTAYTQAELDATAAMQYNAIEAIMNNPPPDAFLAATGINPALFFAPEGPPLAEGQAISGRTATAQITGTTQSKGAEFELSANPIRGLSLILNITKTEARRFDLAQGYLDYLELRRPFFDGPAGDMRLFSNSNTDRTVDPYSTTGNADLRTFFNTDVYSTVGRFIAAQNTKVPELKPWTANIIANYAFQSDGWRKGLNLGGGYRWSDKLVTGYPVISDGFGGEIFDFANPYYGSDLGALDLWLGYERKISGRYNWRIQLNVRNLLADDDLIRTSVNPDNTGAAYRIPEPRAFTLTNTIEF